MARRAMNALQLALGSVGSGIQGYTQARTQREAQEAEQDRLRKAEARQMAMDLANLQAQGYERVDDVQRKQQAAIGAAGSLIGSALDAASGGPVRSLPSMADQKALAQGYATAKPERTLEYGGQQLALRETPTERQERLATAQQMKSRRDAESAAEAARKATEAERARIAKLGEDALKAGRNSPAAAQLAIENPQAFKAIFEDPDRMTAYQRAQLALERERIALSRESASRAAARKAQEGGRPILPSVTESMETLRSITPDQLRKISSYGVSAASQAQQSGGYPEVLTTGVGSLFGVIRDEEKRYAQQVGSIADAVARASEVGVLTNFDINRFRSQIMFSPGDSEQLKAEKLNRALKWASWLESNKPAINEGRMDKVTGTPESTMRYQLEPRKAGESPAAYLARTGG